MQREQQSFVSALHAPNIVCYAGYAFDFHALVDIDRRLKMGLLSSREAMGEIGIVDIRRFHNLMRKLRSEWMPQAKENEQKAVDRWAGVMFEDDPRALRDVGGAMPPRPDVYTVGGVARYG